MCGLDRMEFSLDSLDISNSAENIIESYDKNPVINGIATKSSDRDSEDAGRTDALRDLSSWEKWLLKKTIDDIDKKKMQKQLLIQAKTKEKEEKLKWKEKKIKAGQCHKRWVNEKDEETLKKRKEKKEQKQLEILETEAKKMTREEKSKECFREWYQMKTKLQTKQNQLETEKHRIKMKEQEHKQQLAEIAYRDWLHQTTRSESQPEKWWTNTKQTHKNPSWIGPLDNMLEDISHHCTMST